MRRRGQRGVVAVVLGLPHWELPGFVRRPYRSTMEREGQTGGGSLRCGLGIDHPVEKVSMRTSTRYVLGACLVIGGLVAGDLASSSHGAKQDSLEASALLVSGIASSIAAGAHEPVTQSDMTTALTSLKDRSAGITVRASIVDAHVWRFSRGHGGAAVVACIAVPTGANSIPVIYDNGTSRC